MKAIIDAAHEVQTWMENRSWRFCFIGGLAVIRWGEPRFTRDADATLFTGFGDEDEYIEALLATYPARYPDAKEFALRHRVVLMKTTSGQDMDISLGGFPFEDHSIHRSSKFEFAPGILLRTCSAEDLIVMKAFADRAQDWVDIEGILIREGEILKWNIVDEELPPLCDLKENPGIVPRLQTLRSKLRIK